MNVIGSNMKLLREHTELSQEKFAKRFKSTRANINVYESGKAKSLPADLVENITNYFNITNKQLLQQKLTKEDLKNATGKIESVLEVKYESALREIEYLKQALEDKVEIIRLLKGAGK